MFLELCRIRFIKHSSWQRKYLGQRATFCRVKSDITKKQQLTVNTLDGCNISVFMGYPDCFHISIHLLICLLIENLVH